MTFRCPNSQRPPKYWQNLDKLGPRTLIPHFDSSNWDALFEETVDCGLQVGDGPKDAALEPPLRESRRSPRVR